MALSLVNAESPLRLAFGDPPLPRRGGGSGPKMLHRNAGELSAKLTEGAYGDR